MNYRGATQDDVRTLASMNAELILDEGHRNTMTVDQLAGRMAGWLEADYECMLFEDGARVAGYALFRRDEDFVYLRQLFVSRDRRRAGIGRAAIEWLRQHAWLEASRVRIEVLAANERAIQFWRSIGFEDYALTMEFET